MKVTNPYTLEVSIHAPREGCDLFKPSPSPDKEFQFTHPGRGATSSAVSDLILLSVSIHAPREGCDF